MILISLTILMFDICFWTMSSDYIIYLLNSDNHWQKYGLLSAIGGIAFKSLVDYSAVFMLIYVWIRELILKGKKIMQNVVFSH